MPVRLGDDIDDAGYVVQGRVVTDRGSSAAGLRVIAYDKQLKGENELGQTDTGPSGEYVIAYQREQLGRKLFADLEVRVFHVAAQQSDAPARRIEGRLPSSGAPRHRPPGARSASSHATASTRGCWRRWRRCSRTCRWPTSTPAASPTSPTAPAGTRGSWRWPCRPSGRAPPRASPPSTTTRCSAPASPAIRPPPEG